jgi:hypothetical protein
MYTVGNLDSQSMSLLALIVAKYPHSLYLLIAPINKVAGASVRTTYDLLVVWHSPNCGLAS